MSRKVAATKSRTKSRKTNLHTKNTQAATMATKLQVAASVVETICVFQNNFIECNRSRRLDFLRGWSVVTLGEALGVTGGGAVDFYLFSVLVLQPL